MLYHRVTINKSHIISVLTGLVMILVTFGCSSNVTQQETKGSPETEAIKSAENFSAPIPLALSRHLVTGDKLSAKLIIDKGTSTEKTVTLKVESASNKISGTVDDLTAGTHTFDIVYYIDSGGTLVEVATARQSVPVAAGPKTSPTPVTFAASDLRYTDSDGDGLTNLAELEIGTKFNDAADRPKTELLRSSQNYVLSDTMGINPTEGKTTVVGGSKSANYTLY